MNETNSCQNDSNSVGDLNHAIYVLLARGSIQSLLFPIVWQKLPFQFIFSSISHLELLLKFSESKYFVQKVSSNLMSCFLQRILNIFSTIIVIIYKRKLNLFTESYEGYTNKKISSLYFTFFLNLVDFTNNWLTTR